MTRAEVLAFAQEIADSPAGEGQSAQDLIQSAQTDLLRSEFDQVDETSPHYWQAIYERIDANASHFYGPWS